MVSLVMFCSVFHIHVSHEKVTNCPCAMLQVCRCLFSFCLFFVFLITSPGLTVEGVLNCESLILCKLLAIESKCLFY